MSDPVHINPDINSQPVSSGPGIVPASLRETEFTEKLAQEAVPHIDNTGVDSIVSTAEDATLRLAPFPDIAEHDSSATLIDKRPNNDGSYTYFALSVAHAANIRSGGAVAKPKYLEKLLVALPDGRSFEGRVFPKTDEDLAIIAFTVPATEKQIPDAHIAKVASEPLAPGQELVVGGYPNKSVAANDAVFVKNKVVSTGVQRSLKDDPDYDAGILSVDPKANTSLDEVKNRLAKDQTQQQYPNAVSVIAIENATTSKGLSGSAYFTLNANGEPVVSAVHNGRIKGADGLVRATTVNRDVINQAVDSIHRTMQTEPR